MNKMSKIIFKGFHTSLERKQIGDITTSFSGGTPKSSNKSYYEGNIPFIRSGEVKSKQTELFISDEGLQNSSAKMVSQGDILYALYGATSGEVAISQINGAINQAILAIKPKSGYSSEFIMNYLKKEKNNILEKYLQGGQGNLSAAIVKSIELNLPSLAEQSAIGSLFRTLDDLLASYKDNLTNYQSLKATMLSKMFPKAGQTVPEIRLDGFEGEWENIRLGNCAIIKGRLGWKSLKQEEYTEVGPSMIAGKHIKNGVIDWGKVDHIPQWRYEESPDIMLKNGDIIFSKDGSLGNPALVLNLKEEATINSTMMLVRLYKEILPQFFYQVLTSSVFQKLIYLKVSGSSIPHLFQADMQDFKFFAPCIEEQQAIGAYFSNLDSLISAHQEKISQLETLKKKFLQDMFI